MPSASQPDDDPSALDSLSGVLFVETPTFSKRLRALYDKRALDAEGYREMQNALYERTTRIDSIPGVPDVHKARWGASGRGKRGGLRVITYDCARRGIVYLLMIYEKAEREDLTPEQRKRLARLVDDALRPECEGPVAAPRRA
ncbi:MAG: type II toxin-antitoxin system RelE/ParE family toxin [Rhodothermales bacterium]